MRDAALPVGWNGVVVGANDVRPLCDRHGRDWAWLGAGATGLAAQTLGQVRGVSWVLKVVSSGREVGPVRPP
jgi:hypothetical protein